MIDNKSVFDNPIIPNGYYYAKVLRIEAEPVLDSKFPKLYIQLRLHPSYGLPEGTLFSAILFPTSKTYFHYKNFYNTYMLGQFTDALDTAIGHWGCVQIYPSILALVWNTPQYDLCTSPCPSEWNLGGSTEKKQTMILYMRQDND